ncbi:MAG: PQQ-binding-like beta-propeller repeat protein [Pseudomonadota bacterium]
MNTNIFCAGMALALTSLVASCGLFDDDDEKLQGERIRIRQAQSQPTLATGGGAAIPAPVQSTSWTQTNGNASHASGHLAGPSTLSRAWTADAGTGGSGVGAITSGPIIIGGRVFTMDAGSQISAFDAGGGSVAWRTEIAPEGEDGEDGFGGGIAAEGQRIFATTGFGEVVALSAASGEVLWRQRGTAPYRAAPAVLRGTVVAVTRDNQAVALDANTGDLVWRVAGIAGEAGLLGGASPAIAGDLAVLPFGSGEVQGVQLSTGRQIWTAVLGGARRGVARSAISDVTGDPVIAGRAVITANQSGRMVAIDGQTGRRGWTRSIGSSGPLWAAGDSLFLVSDNAEVLRLTLQSGQTIWRTELPAFEDPEDREDPIAYSGPVLTGGRLLVTDSLGNLLSLDPATGEQGATVDLTDGGTSGVSVAGNTVYVLTDDGTLQAFR